MLLLPIGRDETMVRRTPIVSYAIIALNVAVFVVVNLILSGAYEKRIEAKFNEAFNYLDEHQYLELPEELAEFVAPETPHYLAEARAEYARAGELPYSSVLRQQQEELDKLAAEFAMLLEEYPIRRLGFVPAKPSLLTRVTSLFVHSDLWHLLGNMLFFFATGPFLEDVFGRRLFTALYFSAGLFATACHASIHPDSTVTLVGASGAIAGVMGAYFLRFLRSKTQFLFMPIVFIPRLSFRFFLPSYVVFPLWFLMQVWCAYHETEKDAVAFGAHVGGFVLGFLTGGVVRYFKVEEKFIDPKITAEISWARNRNLDDADAFRAKEDIESARASVARCLREEADNLDALALDRELALEAWDWDGWIAGSSRLLDIYVKKKESELALQLIHETIEAGGANVPERFFLRAADLIVRFPEERAWGLDLYKHVADKGRDSQNVLRALLRIARLRRESGDNAAARDVLERAARHPDCVGHWKSAVDSEAALLFARKA